MTKTAFREPMSFPSWVRCRQTGPVCPTCEDNPALRRPQPMPPVLETKTAPRPNQGAVEFLAISSLVRALRKEGHQHHQVREGEQPLIRMDARGFRGPCDKAKVAALRKIVHVLDANSRQIRDFRIGKNLLARLYGDHGPTPQLHPHNLRCRSLC